MTAQAFFDAARQHKRELTGEGLSQADVDALNAVIGAWGPISAPSGAETAPNAQPSAFFDALRASFGTLDQSQVDGFNRLLGAMGKAGWPVSWVAYGLATAWWETAKQMQPVEEGYYLGPAKAKAHQKSLRYYPWYGRGDVQLTWERNYRMADDELGLGGRLVANPDLALDPETSARILVWGMAGGKFTTKKLADYLPDERGTFEQFKQARRIINGTDKWELIAGYALKFQDALSQGGWS